MSLFNNLPAEFQNMTYLNRWLNSSYIQDSFNGLNIEKMLFNNSSNFFNPSTIMDIFFDQTDSNFLIPQMQNFLNTNTNDFILDLWEFTNNSDFIVSYNSDLILSNLWFSSSIFDNTNLFNINNMILSEISLLTKPKTDPFKIVEVIPEHQNTFEIFEVISLNIDNSLYEFLHLPEFKLYYPEPFIASPSFVHEELWFIHILHYQHWLWFCFISLIMLFFITFINVVRWCNPRNRPKRETRGVSRSKCADLITACVPVSWAATIIISESVDSADYYDGFGTGEIVVGIRAYQWGWEYFFPKNIDLNYTVNPSYSTMTGNSLKYSNTSQSNSEASHFWKNMRSKNNNNLSSAPTHSILSPTDNSKVLNFINFNNLGSSTITSSNAFKKIQSASKTNPQTLFNNASDFNLKFNKINNLYLADLYSQDSLFYGIKRQHNYASTSSLLNSNKTNLDNNSVSKLIDYNYGSTLNEDTSNNLNLNSKLITNTNYTNILDNGKEFGSIKSTKAELVNPRNVTLGNNDLISSTNKLSTLDNLKADNIFYKTFFAKSPNQQILANDRNIRNIETFNPNKVNYNFSQDTNAAHLVNEAKTTFLESHIPTSSTGSNLLNKSFDKFTNTNMNSPLMAAKEELAPNFIFTPFWASLWSNSDPNLRLDTVKNYVNLEDKVSIPNIIEYSEYDFRNWQFIELLEDIFWESTYSSYTQDEYLNLLNNSKDIYALNKQEALFTNFNNLLKLTPKTVTKPFFKDFSATSNLSTLPIFSEESYSNPALLTLNNYGIYDNESEVDLSDDAYSNSKFINYIYYMNYLSTVNLVTNNVQPFSYIQTLNPFRSNFEESLNNFSLNESNNNLDQASVNDLIDLRSSNFIKLRSTTKNAIVTFNALQKVFRPRFDEGRSNVRAQDLSNTHTPYPFLSEKRVPFEQLLGKNKESFFSPTNYKNYLSSNYSDFSSSLNSLNIYFGNIPFLLSMQSDASRHMWFDWQSRWTSIEVQPSSVARYSLLGIPYSTKNFEYATQQSDSINDSETYLIRLAKARKNYMSNWALSPYLYNRISEWYSTNGFLSKTLGLVSTSDIRLVLDLSKKYWEGSDLYTLNNNMTPSISDINTPGRASWKPSSNIQGYNYRVSTLINILSKREYLYREYFLNKGFTVNLPKYLTASPTNSLVEEVKAGYSIVDPTSFSSEIQRDFFYEISSNYKFQLLNSFMNISNNYESLSTIINLNSTLNQALFYLFNSNYFDNLSGNNDLYKNQYRPIRKGISNMIRLHATGAIAMPTEIRLHILASSKDIIHSWSIPSAGIKIDCVPGYSSHRVTIFLVSGIFWGQCMEICGRFHHWMPIIVYFMKRDLFFLWCTHFIHLSPNDLTFNASANELLSKVRYVSFSGVNWNY